MFVHMKATVEAAGGSTDDIIKMTVWLKDRTHRGPVNVEWLKMFPGRTFAPGPPRALHGDGGRRPGAMRFHRGDRLKEQIHADLSSI